MKMEKRFRRLAALVAAGWFALTAAAEPAATNAVSPRNYYGNVARRFAGMLPKYHVLQQPLDETISHKAWTNLVTFYDFDHSVFLQGDLDRFALHEPTIAGELAAGDVAFGFEVRNLYVRRLKERVDFATNLLATADWDFTTNETYRIRRKDAPWPKSVAEAEEHWRKRMKNEVLVALVNSELDRGTNQADLASAQCASNRALAVTNLIRKYRQYVIALTEPDEEMVLQSYLSAVARAYDPHSDYMSPAAKEDFDMDMNLTLCGVGAVLSLDDGALKINEVMPGGPMDVDGRIKEGDKIVGVGQGDGEVEDVMWQPMRKTIRKIRGPKGTRVTLEIQPRSDPSGVTRRRVELVRDEIKLEDQAATGRVETVAFGGVTNRLGYIYLPGFYGTMDKRYGEEGFRSAALDVAEYIADFNAEGVEGLVLDLRGNGGGSLKEAVLLSALFVHEGPVVQIRDVSEVGSLPIPLGNPVAFRRPLVVLTDRSSASASEIVAGHLQDVDRAIVVGDGRTHGKGTVQTVMGMGPDKYGSMKITSARFYRINGRSTQVEGVAADIRLPSLLDSLDIGEDKLPNALPISRILPANYAASWNLGRHLPTLKARSAARLEGDARYAKHIAAVEGMKAMSEREEVPLEYAARKAMMAADRELSEDSDEREDEEAELAGAEDEAAGESKSAKKRRRRNQRPEDDVVLDETFRILADLVREVGGEQLPPPVRWWD